MPVAEGGDAELNELLESLHRLERGHRTDVLHRLCTYASEGSAACHHLLARRLQDGLSVLGSGTDDEQALATDLIILLLTDKSACASLAFDVVYVPLFLSMLATMDSEERACTQFVKVVRSLAFDSHDDSKRVPRFMQKLVSLATMSAHNHPRAARLVGDIVCHWVAAPNHKSDLVKALIDARIVWDCVSACRYVVGKAGIGKLEEHKELLMSLLRILNVVAVVSAGSRELVKLEMDAHATVLLVLSRRSEPGDLQILLMALLYPIWWRHASLRAMMGCVHDIVDMLRETTSPNEKTAATNALVAACKDTPENIELVPVVELLAIC